MYGQFKYYIYTTILFGCLSLVCACHCAYAFDKTILSPLNRIRRVHKLFGKVQIQCVFLHSMKFLETFQPNSVNRKNKMDKK